MAYLDPTFPREAIVAASRQTAAPLFTPLERTAVRIGATDCLGSLGRHPRWLRLRSALFGMTPANGLADPRLEALRRLVVELRHAAAASTDGLVAGAVDQGVAQDQAGALARHFARRGTPRWRWSP